MAIPGTAGPSSPERALPVAPDAPDTTDWPKQATDSIVRVVDTVRDKTAGPAVTAARGIVYGTVLGILAIPFGVMLLAMFMRASERILIKIGETWDIAFLLEPMWLVYLLYGLLFFIVGNRLWARARKAARVPA